MDLSLPFLVKKGITTEEKIEQNKEWYEKLISLYQPQMSYGAEIVELTTQFFKKELEFTDQENEILEIETNSIVFNSLLEKIKKLNEFNALEIKKIIKEVQKETKVKGKNLFMPIRVAVTGETHGPELSVSLELLGKETVVNRIKKCLK